MRMIIQAQRKFNEQDRICPLCVPCDNPNQFCLNESIQRNNSTLKLFRQLNHG